MANDVSNSSTYGTAVCGPACTVVWRGKTGNRLPYPDPKLWFGGSGVMMVAAAAVFAIVSVV